jgi:uncharacterized membrane protein
MVFATRFRHDLARALPEWLSDDLVSPEQAEKLRDRYRLDELEGLGRSGFVTAMLTFGALLVGLGVLSFVAANWELISREVRAIVGLVLLVALNTVGFRYWSQPEKKRQGGAILALAGFLLGGDLVLMAQWFQISGSSAGLFFAWGLGCLAMGAGLAHVFLIGMAAVLFLSALVAGASLPWLFPWLFALVFLPLGALTRSRAVWFLGALGALVSLQFLVFPLGVIFATVGLLVGLVGLWSLSELAVVRQPLHALRMRLNGREVQDEVPAESAIARPLVLIALLGVLHAWSFQALWGGHWTADPVSTPSLVSAGVMAVAAIALYIRASRRPAEPWLHRMVGLTAIGLSALLFLEGVPLPHSLLVNGMLLAVQVALAWRGLARAERLWFWLGFGSLCLQAFERFVEFDTGLLMKSLAFVLWGVVMIAVGIWFERTIARSRTPVAA